MKNKRAIDIDNAVQCVIDNFAPDEYKIFAHHMDVDYMIKLISRKNLSSIQKSNILEIFDSHELLEEVDADDLINELTSNTLSQSQINDLKALVTSEFNITNMIDLMKYDFLLENFDKLKLEDLEKLI